MCICGNPHCWHGPTRATELSAEESRGYVCAVADLLEHGEAQKMYDLAENDPFPNDFTKGWQRACLDYGAKVDGP